MYKYLAGIVVKTQNDVVNGRITSPLTAVPSNPKKPPPKKKRAAGNPNPIMHPIIFPITNYKSKARPKMTSNPPIKRAPGKHNPETNGRYAQVKLDPDPVSYIGNIRASSTSSLHDMPELLPRNVVASEADSSGSSGLDSAKGPKRVSPPPVSRYPSSTSFRSVPTWPSLQWKTDSYSDSDPSSSVEQPDAMWIAFPEQFWDDL